MREAISIAVREASSTRAEGQAARDQICNPHVIRMQSACNPHAIRMQSACNHHAISM